MLQPIYHRGPCFAFVKPAGLLTQAPAAIDSMEARVKDWLRATEQKEGNIYLGVVQQLDRPVSGVMVFARHVRAARRLAEQFESRTVRKIYWSVVAGHMEQPSGTWHDTMRKVPDEPRAELVPADHPLARSAILHYRVLKQWTDATGQALTWLEIQLETGRMHQIRLQSAARGHAILGDTLYGSGVAFGEAFADERLRAIALHGRSLTFLHPMTQEAVSLEAPLPENWNALGVDS